MKFNFSKLPKINKFKIPRLLFDVANTSYLENTSDISESFNDSIDIPENSADVISDIPKKNKIENPLKKLSLAFSSIKGVLLLMISKIKGMFSGVKTKKPNFKINFIGKKLFFGIAIIILLIIAGTAFIYLKGKIFNKTALISQSSDNRSSVLGAKATVNINKEFSFPLKDAKGKEVSQIKFSIENAELRNEIVIKGQKAVALQGKTFLILNLKITNEHNQAIQLNTRDYIRLSLNGNENEWIAPDIHNDPVEIQAIATKYTRVGYPINDSDTNLQLRIGEINGDKQTIPLSFN